MKKVFSVLLMLVLVFGLMVSSAGAAYSNGCVTGGGQIRAESSVENENGKDCNYKISLGLDVYIADGILYLRDTSVIFHNVNSDIVKGGKFKGETLLYMNFFNPNSALFQIEGKFNGEPGYILRIVAVDGGEPGLNDNIRIRMYHDSALIYDSSNDFSHDVGQKCYLDIGNLQIEGIEDIPVQ
jgi:hypothetical protein